MQELGYRGVLKEVLCGLPCAQEGQTILVQEYMENGDLFHAIAGDNGRGKFSWCVARAHTCAAPVSPLPAMAAALTGLFGPLQAVLQCLSLNPVATEASLDSFRCGSGWPAHACMLAVGMPAHATQLSVDVAVS
jgi:hypothetical protein